MRTMTSSARSSTSGEARRDHCCRAAPGFAEPVDHGCFGVGVDCGGRFDGEQYVGCGIDGAGESDPLPLSTRKVTPAGSDRRIQTAGQCLHDVLGDGGADGRTDPVVVGFETPRNDVAHCAGEHLGIVVGDNQPTPELVAGNIMDPHTGPRHTARNRCSVARASRSP